MWDLSQQCKAGLTSKNQFSVIHHTNKITLKTCGIISIDAENVFDKIQYKLIIKSFSKPGTESNFFNLIKDVYEKITSYFTVSDFMDFH